MEFSLLDFGLRSLGFALNAFDFAGKFGCHGSPIPAEASDLDLTHQSWKIRPMFKSSGRDRLSDLEPASTSARSYYYLLELRLQSPLGHWVQGFSGLCRHAY